MDLSLPPFERPPRFEVEAPVIAHDHVVLNEFEIVLYAPDVAQAARPGQFLELLYNESYTPLIRRPFSIYRVDRDAGTCSVLYLARGSFTSGLAQKQIGDTVSLVGPLGRPFSWQQDSDRRHILIAGGIGAPPLYFLASEICRKYVESGNKAPAEAAVEAIGASNVIVLNGARTRDRLVGLVEFGGLDILLHALTDDGSHGRQGQTTDLLAALLSDPRDAPTSLYACGPTPMLRSVGDLALRYNLPCQLSVETSMPCGIGTCNGCAIAVKNAASEAGIAYARACWDGPVFEARDIVWDR